MIRHHRAGAVLTTALLICTTTSIGIIPTAHADTTEPSKILLMLDASGSMNGKDPSGLTKIEAAKKALNATIDAIPTGTHVGLRVYGATQPGGQPTPAACADTQLVAPLAPIDPTKLKSTINGFTAKGETPIAYSLTEAAKDLGPDGERHIILVSDGKESCATNPCDDVKKITGLGINLHIDTVGFNVDTDARKQLSCIADASQGTYYDATNADQLQTSLKKLSTRAARPFTVIGTPITGTPTPNNPPTIQAGDYTDTFPASGTGETTQVRYYKVKRTMSVSDLHVTVLGRFPTPTPGEESSDIVTTTAELMTGDRAVQCDRDFNVDHKAVDSTTVTTVPVVAWGMSPGATSYDTKATACAHATELVLAVTRKGENLAAQPVQLRIMEQPLLSKDGLKAGDDADPRKPAPAEIPVGPAQPVVGGSRFDDAPPIQPGNYVADLVPGEIASFSIKLDYGQQLIVKNDPPDRAWVTSANLRFSDWLLTSNKIYSPKLADVSANTDRYGMFQDDPTTAPYINYTGTIGYENRWTRQHRYSMPGTYTILVSVPAQSAGGRDPQGNALTGNPIPVPFTVAVKGQPVPAPKTLDAAALQTSASPSATTTASATSKPTTKPSSATSATEPASTAEPTPSTPVGPIIGGALVLLAAVGGIGYAIWRRRH